MMRWMPIAADASSRSKSASVEASRYGERMRAASLRTGSSISVALACMAGAVHAASIEARLGGAWNAPLPMRVEQRGESDLKFTARWSTRALEFPLYYGVRIGLGARDHWALDLTHHKIHLRNPPPEIESFSISHGYNLLVVQRRFEEGARHLGLGAGVVVAHPESRVRGRRGDESGGWFRSGYHLSGPCLDLFGGTALPTRGHWFASAELRLTVSTIRVPVADGDARLHNVAVHGTLGLGWRDRH